MDDISGCNTKLEPDDHKIYRAQLGLKLCNSKGGWHGGKKSPPKITPLRSTSPKKVSGSYYKPTKGRGSARKRTQSIPDTSQSSISEFVIRSPRVVRIGSAARDVRSNEDQSSRQ